MILIGSYLQLPSVCVLPCQQSAGLPLTPLLPGHRAQAFLPPPPWGSSGQEWARRVQHLHLLWPFPPPTHLCLNCRLLPLCSVCLLSNISHIGQGWTQWLATLIWVLFFNFLKLWVIFIFLYHKNVFLQYLSCQFITNEMQGFYFYWKHYYSYVFTF